MFMVAIVLCEIKDREKCVKTVRCVLSGVLRENFENGKFMK